MEGKVGNTLRSHKLIEYALQKGGLELQNRVVEELFSGHFEKGGDITCIDFLLSIAENCGLDVNDAEYYIESYDNYDSLQFENCLKKQEEYWRNEFYVKGVPTFIING